MYDVDFLSLVSCMRRMCGYICNVCVNYWMSGRLELMCLVFQVTIYKFVVWWASILMLSKEV